MLRIRQPKGFELQDMELDLRQPTLVIVGAWNPAIFQDPWIAKHLWGIPEGQEVAVAYLTEHDQRTRSTRRTIRFMNGIGLNVTSERLEIFLTDFSPEGMETCEQFCRTIGATLSHTPVGALGSNLHFNINDPTEDLLDLLETKDTLDERYSIISQKHTSTIELDDCQLNFSWIAGPNTYEFDFNFHHESISSAAEIEKLCEGILKKTLARATDLLSSVYSLNDYDIVSHQIPNAKP